MTPGTYVAPVSGDAQRPPLELRGAGSDPSRAPDSSLAASGQDLPRRAGTVATSVCVLMRVFCAGFEKGGVGLHFAPHRPRAEFLRYPGSGGLRGATRPAPKHPRILRKLIPAPAASSKSAAQPPGARAPRTRSCVGGSPRTTARVGARGACVCGRVRPEGARPSAPAGFPGDPGQRKFAESLAPLVRSAQSSQMTGVPWAGDRERAFGAPLIRIHTTPEPLEVGDLNKSSEVATQLPLLDKTPGSLRSNQLASLGAPPT